MKKLVLSVVVLMVLFSTGIAHAAAGDFFDDSNGKWWMNENWWTKNIEETTTDISQGTTYRSRLEVTSAGAGFAGYASKWSLSFDQDFAFTVNFHYNPSDTSTGGLALAGMPPDATDDSGITMYAGNISGSKKYEWDWMLPTGSGEAFADRTATNGTLSASYDASEKEMVFSSDEAGVSKIFDLSFIGLGDHLAVGLGGGSEGAVFIGSEAYLTNFNITNGTPVAPEPVSTVLFLTGGTILVVRRLRRK